MAIFDLNALASTVETGLDPVVEAYKRDVDRTLLRENLKLSVEDRFRRFESFMRGVYELRSAGKGLSARSEKEIAKE